MTVAGLAKRLAGTWFAVAWFSYFVLDVLGDYDVSGRILRSVVAGFFVALTTAPAYYWRFKQKPEKQSARREP